LNSLDGKVALITGGTAGIGLTVAKNFVDSGATVVITGRRADGDSIAAEIGASFDRCDATVEAEVARCFAAVEQSAGKIDVLVINAGGAADEGSIETFPRKACRSSST